ncbi:centrosomal protein of 57 kDa [Aulostomus maculatus]
METVSKTSASDATREKELPPPLTGPVSDSLSLPSYKDYPAHRPFINSLHTPKMYRPSSPIKSCPETNCAAILSALRNLQEKIRRLELEKGTAEPTVRTTRMDASRLQSDRMTQNPAYMEGDRRRERGDQSGCNQVLITHLAAAESRCVKLERQLDHMRRMLHNAKAERTSLLKQQVSMKAARSADQQPDIVSEQLEKLDRLEQEYFRLTRTQNQAEMKIHELELKLQEEEHQRKLVQDKANQLQTGLQANRILLQSVSPCLSTTQPKAKKSNLQKPPPQQSSYTQPHYRLSLRDIPFVAGKSVGCSHSVRANVQSVLSLLKRHQPHLCNDRVLSNHPNSLRHSDSCSSSSSSGEELSELLQALQEELRLMSLEHDELMRQLEVSVSLEERTELQREQERLLLKMERKGEQISKLYKHKTQIKKYRKEANTQRPSMDGAGASTAVSTRGHSAGTIHLKPGERSRRNLRLLRDMKALQTSLRT